MTISLLEATPFIGRRRELPELLRALRSARVLTLVGMGGTGKTRLAQRVAVELRSDLLGRCWLVSFAEDLDPALVSLTVATAMEIHADPGDDQTVRIAAAIGDHDALLVLDNCDRVREPCARLAVDLLAACPRLTLLVTSRQPLGIAQERRYPVPPMSLTAPAASERPAEPAGPGESGVDTNGVCDAVALFAERARAVRPDFDLTIELPMVTRLCRALEGLPLAIELAAARVGVLSTGQMLQRLDDRYQLLRRPDALHPGRMRSLQASVDWSHDLCTPVEQLLWARLSVFTGGFDLDAVEEVCSGGDLPRADVLDTLAALADRSLVVRDLTSDDSHFRMLDTIREYGAARLRESGEVETYRRRHHAWYADLAGGFRAGWIGPDQQWWVARMRRNHTDIQTALEALSGHPDTAGTALQMVFDLESYWIVTGLFSEARHWIDAALTHEVAPCPAVARALAVAAYFTGVSTSARVDEAEVLVARGRSALAEDGPDPVAAGYLDFAEGVLLFFRGEAASALGPLERAALTLSEQHETAGVLETLVVLGLVLSAMGRPERAAAVMTQADRITEPAGEVALRGFTLWQRCLDARAAGDLALAERLGRSALEMKWSVRDQLGVALALEGLATVATGRRAATRAGTLLGAAARVWRHAGLSPVAAPYIAAQRTLAEELARGSQHDYAFRRGFRRGSDLPTSEAVAWALGTGDEPDSPLTPREEEVAALVAQGRTDQEIARLLVISVRTAQSHVENIRRKLGFTSRTQIATWFVGRDRP